MFLEDLKRDYSGELSRMYEFIGVSKSPNSGSPLAPQNTREDKRVDRALLRRLRKSGLFLSTHWLLPRKLKALLKPIFRKKIHVEVEWTPELKSFATNALRADAERFLDAHGKPDDYWSWE
jgi:hypothetical protein